MSVLSPLNLRGLSAKDASTLVLDAVAQGEGLCLEFKSSFQKEVIESLTAFANSQGGSILVGAASLISLWPTDCQSQCLKSHKAAWR